MIRLLTDDELASIGGGDAGFGALETEKGCLPLVALDLDVKIDGLVAYSTVAQSFRNVFPDPLEATYVFPLPPRAAVIGFRLIVDGAVIEGRIDDRAQARADYDAAIARGQSAAIAEEERADVFTIRVGNIPPRSLARVEFTLVEPLSIDALEATYRFPLVVSQRYCPGATLSGDPTGDGIEPDTDLVPDASRISPPVLLPGFPNPVRLGIRVAVGGPAPLAEDLAASLPVKLIPGHDTLQMVVEPGQRLDRDFVLRWPLDLGSVPKASFAIEPDAMRPVGMGRKEGSVEAPGDGTFSLVVFPPKVAVESRSPRDVVFLLDRSSSMGGWQIAAARRAIARTLDTLSLSDRVAVIAFDSVLDHMLASPTLIPATDRNRWSILEWLGKIEARGGTEMEAALKAGLALLERPRRKKGEPKPAEGESAARDPILILVTDGQIGDEDRVLARLEKSLGKTTLHVVGIDTAANAGLLTRLADTSGGTHDIVESEDRLDAVMDRIQERLVAPIVTDVSLAGDGIEILVDTIVPAKRPSLFPGVPLVLRGRYRGTGPGMVTITGTKQGGGRWRVAATPHRSHAPGLGALWARGRLQQLTDAYAVGVHAGGEAIERRIVDLSTGFGVLCPFTALVAIDARAPEGVIDASRARRIVQPVHATNAVSYFICRDNGSPGPLAQLRSLTERASAGGMEDVQYWPSDDEDIALPGRIAPSAPAIDASAPSLAPALDRPAEQAMIREALAMLRPRSGRLDDVPEEMVSFFLGEVSKVLAMLRADGWASALLEALEQAFESFKKNPDDRDALLRLLDILADFSAPVDRWWRGDEDETDVVF